MLAGAGLLDLIIPRGGKSLVERVQREARVPVLAHAEGLYHTYVHAAADPGDGPRRSSPTPRCGGPGFAARPRHC